MGELDDTYGSSVNARMASHAGEHPEHTDDAPRAAKKGEPPVVGAQWDEVHRRWEAWDESAQAWVVVGDDAGDGIPPREETPFTSFLARELQHGEELEAQQPVVPDVERRSPEGPAPRGAQWNEIAARWERWDEASESWVEAIDEPEAPDGP